MRSHYWTCSKFADWLRGTPKPGAETAEGWEAWTEKATKAHPFRYWLADDALHFIEKAFYWPTDKLYSIKYYINNRFITRTHALTANPKDIKPGQWRDVGDRFLPCMFNELVDFVEVELAWWHLAWNDKERAKYNAPWWRFGWWNLRLWRCPQAGLDNLAWQCNLTWDEEYAGVDIDENYKGKPTPQAVKAQEIVDLYNWWTVTRPARPDPYEVSGWRAICEERRQRRLAEGKPESFMAAMNDRTPAEKKASAKALKDMNKIEAAYEKEDENMMIRLIKVRRGLWT